MNIKSNFFNFKMKFKPNGFHMLLWINIMLLINLWSKVFGINQIISNILIYSYPLVYSLVMELKIRFLDDEEDSQFSLAKPIALALVPLVILLYLINILNLDLMNL